MPLLRLFSFIVLLMGAVQARETITFPSGDGLLVTADAYIQNEDRQAPFIVLFHQAGWSRGEYLETAVRLNTMGFNCMAIDQRSGGSIKGVTNETEDRATAQGKGTGFLDAVPDMLAAIAYAKENFATGAVIGAGSSYSSALILKLASDDADLVDGVASFSPGEYFSPSNLIRTAVASLAVPVFISSRRNEQSSWQPIYDAIPASTEKSSFLPVTSGQHGSRALWPEFSDSESYWDAYEPFLEQWLPSLANYRAANGLAADGSDDLVAADGDSVSHLVRYALGAGSLPEVVQLESEPQFEFVRFKNRTDVIFSIEASANPAGDWAEIWSSETDPFGGSSTASETVRIALTEGQRFARLRVSVQPE